MFFFVLILACVIWMHITIRRMMVKMAPEVVRHVEDDSFGTPGWQE
jgi:hypothetical protein